MTTYICTGTQVIVHQPIARHWGCKKFPAVGTIIGPDPRKINDNVYTVMLEETQESVYLLAQQKLRWKTF